jgi:hypothetical protein
VTKGPVEVQVHNSEFFLALALAFEPSWHPTSARPSISIDILKFDVGALCWLCTFLLYRSIRVIYENPIFQHQRLCLLHSLLKLMSPVLHLLCSPAL